MDSLAVKRLQPGLSDPKIQPDFTSLTVSPIATIRSPFTSRRAIPRQSGLVPTNQCVVQFNQTPENELLLRGIEEFSHIWIIFWIHGLNPKRNKALIDPPRKRKLVGTLASRSPYRPNPLGLSVVKLVERKATENTIELVIAGSDLLDGTPVLDIKPYIPYADAIPEAEAAWASSKPARLTVNWTEQATSQLRKLFPNRHPNYQEIITDIIAYDPRPFHKKGDETDSDNLWKCYYDNLRILWRVEQTTAVICQVEAFSEGNNTNR